MNHKPECGCVVEWGESCEICQEPVWLSAIWVLLIVVLIAAVAYRLV